MIQSSLARKLRIQPGQHVLILNQPSRYVDELGPLPKDVMKIGKPARDL